MKNKLCKDCLEYFDDIVKQLEQEAEKCNRGGMIIDCLRDIVVSIKSGDISQVIE